MMCNVYEEYMIRTNTQIYKLKENKKIILFQLNYEKK